MSDVIVAALLPAVPAFFAWLEGRRHRRGLQTLKIEVDGRLDQLLADARLIARAAGRVEGMAEQKAKKEGD